MRHFLLMLAFCAMTFLGGCAVLDALFGVNEKGESQPSILNTIVTTALNGLFPGSGAAVAGLGGLYAAYRGKKWKSAYHATADVIEEHGDLPKVAMKEKLKDAHAKAGVITMTAKQAKKYPKKPAEVSAAIT